MPFEKGHTINKGNHNVGRKSTIDENAKNKAIEKAWNKINAEIDEKDVKEIALPIALKTMTDKTDITTGGEKLQGVIMYPIKDGEDSLETTT